MTRHSVRHHPIDADRRQQQSVAAEESAYRGDDAFRKNGIVFALGASLQSLKVLHLATAPRYTTYERGLI